MMSQNLSSAAVVIGALRVKMYLGPCRLVFISANSADPDEMLLCDILSYLVSEFA